MVEDDPTARLLRAAMEGDISGVRSAIEDGANINARDLNQSTPLHLAVAIAEVELIRLLVEKGADILAKNVSQQTPLDVAQKDGRPEVAALLSDRMQQPSSYAARIAKERERKDKPELSR